MIYIPMRFDLGRPRGTNKLAGRHWRAKRNYLEPWRAMAALQATVERKTAVDLPLPERQVVMVHFRCIYKSYTRGLDIGNAAPEVKAIIDGLADGGLIPDDSEHHVHGQTQLVNLYGQAYDGIHLALEYLPKEHQECNCRLKRMKGLDASSRGGINARPG